MFVLDVFYELISLRRLTFRRDDGHFRNIALGTCKEENKNDGRSPIAKISQADGSCLRLATREGWSLNASKLVTLHRLIHLEIEGKRTAL